MSDDEARQIRRDQRQMRCLFYVFLFGILMIWTGLLSYSKDRQAIGSLICLSGFAWLALGGWRVMLRCSRRK